MNTGVVGVDAIGNTGEGLPELLSHAIELGGRFARCVNDPEGKEQRALRDAGYEVLHRIHEPEKGANDDDAHINIKDYRAWIERHLAETIPPTNTLPGSIIKPINEPGELDNDKLIQFMRETREYLAEVNTGISLTSHRYRRASFPGWGYGHPSDATLAELDYETRLWVADGHDLSAHEGYDPTYLTFEQAYPSVIGRHLWTKQTYKPRAFVIDEFASSWDAHNGWEYVKEDGTRWQTDEETADKWEQACAWYAANGFYVIPFTFRKWKNFFRYAHSQVITSRLVHVNRTYPVQETPPVAIDMLSHVCPTNGKLYHMSSGEDMQSKYDAEGYGRHQKNALWEEIWAQSFGGVEWIMRGMDTSQFPPASGGTVYALYHNAELTKYGGKWLPRYATVGKTYTRDEVWVQRYVAATGAKIPEGSGRDVTYFQIVAYHKDWIPEPGSLFHNVAECVYSHNADLSKVNERYFYGEGYGLVGYRDPHMNVIITRENAAPLPAQVVLSWWVRPPFQGGNTMPDVQPPTSGGVKGVVVSLPSGVAYRNIRNQPNSNATDLGDLFANDEIAAYTAALTPDNWCYIEKGALKGWTLWTGITFAPELLPPAEKTYVLPEAQRLVLIDYFTRIRDDADAGLALVKGLPLSPDSSL